MAALESAERALGALREFPLLFGAAGLFAVLKLPVEATRPLRITYDVYAVLALLTFLFTPVLLAGLYGLAHGALAGDGPGSFRSAVGDGYPNLLVANLLYALFQHLLMLLFVLVAAGTFLGLVGGVGAAVETRPDPEAARALYGAAGVVAIGGVVLVSFVYVVVRFTVSFFMQLYKPSAAIGGNGPVAAFAESARLVRANPESTLGFVLLRLFAMILLVLPGVVAVVAMVLVEVNVLGQLTEPTTGILLAVVLVVGFAIGVVELAFLATYRVAFYRSLVEG